LIISKHKLAWSLAAFALGLLTNIRASASPLAETYTGTLTSESGAAGSVVLESFSLTAPSEVTIYTTSYGGGMNLDGTSTGPGGFQPNITLYDNTGFVVANQSPSFSPIANPDPSNGWKGDGYLQDPDAQAGTYYVTLTDWQNQMSVTSTGLNLSTPAYLQFNGPGGSSFQDVQGNTRTDSYALNISGMPLGTSSVPEPATAYLIVPALAAAALVARKRSLPRT
jgi:PEP-CTERM motif